MVLDGDVGYGRPVSDNLKLQVPLPYFDPLLDLTKDDVKLLYLEPLVDDMWDNGQIHVMTHQKSCIVSCFCIYL